MKENKFVKSLMLHIRYPWTAFCIAIVWLGLAIMSNFIVVDNVELLIGAAGVTTVLLAVVGFGK